MSDVETLDPDKANAMVNYACRCVFALADRDPTAMPDPLPMNDRDVWATTCVPLEMISRLTADGDRDRFMEVVQLKPPESAEHKASLLAAQIVATYCNGDPLLALNLWVYADDDIASRAVADIYIMAALIVRERGRDSLS